MTGLSEMNSGWLAAVVGPQWREVEAYAAREGTTAYRAVMNLVHKGLIHDEQSRY